MNGEVLPLPHREPDLALKHAELARLITRFAPHDGVHASAVTGLRLMRLNSPSVPRPALYEPCLCIVVQGRKRSVVGNEAYVYDPLNYLTISVPMLAVSQVFEASAQRPYLCLTIDLDARLIAELLLQVGHDTARSGCAETGLFVAHTTPQLLDAVLRLTRLLLEPPRDVAVLAPLVKREIHYRLLAGKFGHRLRELCVADSQVHRVARAIDLLRKKFTESLHVGELASAIHMSESSLHHRFKAVTGMSPMQFQKQLRLHEARRLMLIEGIDASAAARRVGYESPSQFSREYRRLFGAPPRREIEAMRG